MANTSSSSSSNNVSPYDKIIDMIQGLDLQDDGIVMNHKIKSIERDFCSIVRDENMLNESMEYINDKVLYDGDTSLKFALLFSSRNFDSLAMNDTKVRYKMLNILEHNFLNAEVNRVEDKNRLYNSITLLGEYYHRVRLANNLPITILGQSLLGLLIREIAGNDIIDVKLAKLVLSQITLNGDIMRAQHKDDLTQLLFHVRRNLIEQNSLLPSTKALLLMTLDLYYSNFANLGHMLEEMYTKYLVEESEADSNNYVNGNVAEDDEYENGQPKKWSEQVSEDSFYENDGPIQVENLNVSGESVAHREQPNTSPPQRGHPQKHQHPRQQPKHNHHANNAHPNERPPPPHEEEEQQEHGEEKPLPRWRTQRFNRADDEHSANNNGRNNRRFSGSFDEDRQSGRSDNGSIRLYSINDRLRHSQTKSNNGEGGWDRNNGGYHNFNGNLRGRGNFNGGNRNFNNRNNYDRPPRFQKTDKMRNSMERDQWRNNGGGGGHGHHDEDNSSNVGDAGSRSSSRARTLPRPPKGKFDSHNGGAGNRSQSPNSYRQNNRPQNSRNFSRSNRYSSQSSLASESSSTWDRRHHRRNYSNRQPQHMHHNEWEDTHSVHGQPEEDSWDNKDNNSELVRNARNTTKYMNFLSQK